ncbi:dehydrogenase [Dehalobacter sp. MCB1]|uniref:TorD/DmsD family molecular chaperone n=1 Tax=unclassified Dehalobacter TaxID=2635733 RepID=UPI000E6C22D2|nr:MULTISPECIES: molecular chaperone TorD family protein [unclassified Dehalobacter]RJE47272.1 dehydrogenase [Dehalobacter sp. MCB1]TCX54874.1 dehydrogenase [Dehalobacter sp. 12DCB1]
MEIASGQDSIAILLANRTYLYRLLQNFFGNEPTSEAIAILNSDHTTTSFYLLSIEDSLELIKDFAEQFKSNSEETLNKCRCEYTRLFIGPNRLPAPPWESVYVMKERLIFQESTFKVRQCYLEYNFLPVHYRLEADDHIALELDFMVNLSRLAESAFEVKDMDKVRRILGDQQTFLNEHLLVWTPQYISDLQAATLHPLYQGVANMLRAFLNADRDVVKEILASL